MAVNTKIQVRRGYSTGYSGDAIGGLTVSGNTWLSTTVLAQGEIGFEIDTGKFKIGKDGTTTWASLPYAGGAGSAITAGSGVCVVYDSGNNAYTLSSELFTSGSGLSLSNTSCGSGSGNAYTISLNDRLQEVSKLTGSGLIVSTNSSGVTTRNIAGGTNINVTNGDGISGNPSVALSPSLTGLTSIAVSSVSITGIGQALNVTNDVNIGGTLSAVQINLNGISASGNIAISGNLTVAGSGSFASGVYVGGTAVSLSGHQHSYSEIANFCSGVSSCVDTAITAESGIQTVYNSGVGGAGGTLYVRLSGEALALHNISDTGIIVRTGSATYSNRSITAGNGISITNGNGISGNPSVALSGDITGLSGLTVGNIRVSGNTISSTDTNGNIIFSPNGTGALTVGKVNISGATGSIINNTSIGYTAASSGKFTAIEIDTTTIDNDIIYYNNIARIDLTTSETVINNSGNDLDFRVEGTGNANLLFVDAGLNRVGIGTNSPTTLLSVSGTASFASTINAPNLGAGTSNTTIVLDGSNNLTTRTIDGRVWTSGTLISGTGSAGHIAYWDTNSSISYDSNQLYWDATNNRLGIGTNTPGHTLDVSGSGNITGNLIIGGNLTVNGTTVTANVTTMEVKDSIITLGLASGSVVTDTSFDRGLTLVRGTGLNAFMGWDTSATEFVLLSSGTETGSIYTTGTYGALRVGSVVATGSISANTFSGNGSSLTNLNAGSITGVLGSSNLPTVSVTPTTNGPSGTFVSSLTVDSYGRVTGINSTTHTIATTGVLGIASFSNSNFDVTAGAVSIKTGGISNTNLANSSITLGTTVMALGASSGTLAGLTSISGTSAASPTTLTYCVIDGGTP